MMQQAPTAEEAEQIRQLARRVLAAEQAGDDRLRHTDVMQALPVLDTGGALHSWFVPVTERELLVAFFQFLPDGTLMRFSSFQHRPGEFADCPLAADWLDNKRIQARAMEQCRKDEAAGTSFLSYDGSPERLVWVVPLTDKAGNSRQIYVIGTLAYSAPSRSSVDGIG